MSRARPRLSLLRSDFAKLTAVVLCALALGLAALPRIERHFLVQSGEQSRATLTLSVEGLRGALRRFEPLPALIAERPILARALNAPQDLALLDQVNAQLKTTAERLQASDIYLMDTTGLTIAASSYLKELSFVGNNFAYRPYFTDALHGTPRGYFALGTTSGERGYFYAAPVLHQGRVMGVLALKFTVDGFEQAWRGSPSELVVTDLNDVVFMSSRPDWLFRTLGPLDAAALDDIARAKQYPLNRLVPLEVSSAPVTDRLTLFTVGTGSNSEQFVESTTLLEDVGWRVRILSPTGPAKAQALAALLMFFLMVLLVGLAVALVLSRRARILERLESQRATQALLERRVRERTTDLNVANASLRTEVEERRSAETRLRITQKELVQAGKLAALGQMSAAISHEINQPLAAVKSYADNATTLLDRDRAPEARENMVRISTMADRIAAISGHLRNFARRPQEGIGPVDVVSVIDDSIDLMRARLKTRGAQVDLARPEAPIYVQGGQLRLQQVVVNLLNNALDAMEGVAAPVIRISISDAGPDRVVIAVRDHGPGIGQTLGQCDPDPLRRSRDQRPFSGQIKQLDAHVVAFRNYARHRVGS